jgi:hypothetical protein
MNTMETLPQLRTAELGFYGGEEEEQEELLICFLFQIFRECSNKLL